MKGIAHFATGMCLASFIPGVVQGAANGGLVIALGGVAALLPDTFDFRFERYFATHDLVIEPDFVVETPQEVADRIAKIIQQTIADGVSRSIQFHPGKSLASLAHRTYHVEFDHLYGEVRVFNAVHQAFGSAYAGPIEGAPDDGIEISELGGPSLRFHRVSNAAVVEFLPWHRARTHSIIVALIVGAVALALAGTLAGVAAFIGYLGHIVEDHLGHMGSNLLWPFTRTRVAGARLLHSSDAPINMATIWISLGLLLLNLDRARVTPLITAAPYLLLGVFAPAALMLMVQLRIALRQYVPMVANPAAELFSEIEDGMTG